MNYPFLNLKERDIETGLDFFGARYYASTQGRFISADDFLNDTRVSDPASWSLYAYVHNNPLKYIDPTGEEVDGTELTPEQRQQLIDDWKKKSGYKHIQFVEKNNRFILKINAEAGHEGGSETARTELLAAEKTEFIYDLNAVDGTSREGGEHGVGFATTGFPRLNDPRGHLVFDVSIDFGDFDELQGDNDAIEAQSVGLVVLHEIEHSLHGQKSDYSEPDPGDVEREYINPIRRELELPERRFYSPNKFVVRGEAYEFISYKAKDATIKVAIWKESQVDEVRKR